MTLRLLPCSLLVLSACASTDFNTGDGGIPGLCTPNEAHCTGQVLETCNDEGTKWLAEDCAISFSECVEGTGGARCEPPFCFPENVSCAEDGLTTRTCDAKGERWIDGEKCDPSAGMVCRGGICKRSCEVEAKDRQNVGCTFYPFNLENEKQDSLGVVVSNPNAFEASVTLADVSGDIETKTVPPGALVTFVVAPGKNVLSGTGRGVLAFKLTSTHPVAAYQFSPLNKAEQRSNDASLLLPKPALGKLHYVFSSPVTGVAGICTPPGCPSATYVTVVGVEAATELTIWPSVATTAGGGIPAVPAGQPYTTTIGELEAVQLQSKEDGADLTGTKVKSNKPVVVYGANSCGFLPASKRFCDHLEEQIFPVETWGKSYVAVKYMPRGVTSENDHWRILASEDDTRVTLSGAPGLPTVPALSAGQTFLIETAASFVIEADKPIAVGHYLLSQEAVPLPLDPQVYSEGFQTPKSCAMDESYTSMGDPALALAVPFQQFRDEYIFLTPDTYRYDFVTVMVPPAENPQVQIDGAAIPAPLEKIGDTGFWYARFRVGDGAHRITANTPFGIEVHGYDCNVSYAYGGGLDLEVINPIE